MEPSEEELADLSKACNKLWELDLNRLVPGKDNQMDCGEGKKDYQKEDVAEESLFSWLNKDVFRRPTFSRFSSLLDNYKKLSHLERGKRKNHLYKRLVELHQSNTFTSICHQKD